jgi:hypothetical protein
MLASEIDIETPEYRVGYAESMALALARMVPIRQNFPDRRIQDIPGAIQRELAQSGFAQRLAPGSTVALGVGSRGIANIATIVRSVVEFWKSAGMKPFLFPAMGSHGAATAEGQADVLAHYGIIEETMGCPIVSRLDVVDLGSTPEGIETFMDKTAYDSGGVFLIGRVKWHTDFAGKIESGLFKMMAIGLGKFAGAQKYHAYAYKMGLETVIRSVGRQVLKSDKILGGLAILEDPNHCTAGLSAVPVERMEQKEEENLALVKSWMARIPGDALDILIIDEIGKNYSGAGMDTKIVNRGVNGEYNPWDTAPPIHRIYLRGISEHSYGNGVGVGMADMVHDRILPRINWVPTAINSLTANTPAAIRTPVHFPSDRVCLEKLWPTVGKFKPGDVTIAWIKNSLDLTTLAISENLFEQVKHDPAIEATGAAQEFVFDNKGDLPQCADFVAGVPAATR